MSSGSPSLDQTTIVGRDRERALFLRLLESAMSGDGLLALVSGEAGIGKTTLVRDLCKEASARGCLVLAGGCYDLTTTPPYGPWIEAIFQSYRPVEDMPDAPGSLRDDLGIRSPQSQDELFAEVTAFLLKVARSGPLVVVLEDLHWADRTSLELLRHVARQTGGQPLLLIGSYRDDEITRRHELYSSLPLLVRESGAARINLTRLSSSDVSAFIETLYEMPSKGREQLAEYLIRHSEGNPFYAGELLRGLEDAGALRFNDGCWELGSVRDLKLPPLVRQVINVRLDRLGQTTQEHLRLAAVIGQYVPYSLWRAVSKAGDEELATVIEEALDAAVLEEAEDGSGYRFTHALVREALYEWTVLPKRKSWHRKVGEALATSTPSDPDVVAHHFGQASDERAIDWLIRAGDRAQRSYAWQTSIERFEEAIHLLVSTGDRASERGWLLYRVGKLLRFIDTARGIAYLSEARRIATAIDDRALAANALFDRGMLRCIMLDIRHGLDDMAAGVEALQALRADSHDFDVARVTSWVADALPASELPQGVELDARASPADILTRLGTYVLWLSWAGYYSEALQIAEPYLSQTAAIPAAASGYGDACNALGTIYAALGRPVEARQMFAQARETYQSIGHHILDGGAASHYLRDVVLIYSPEEIAERRRIGAEAEAAWMRGASGGISVSHSCQLPLMLLEGKWDEIRQATLNAPEDFRARIRHVVGATLGTLAREQAASDLAWSWVHEALPEGPATTPGEGFFVGYASVLQRLAVVLCLDAGDLPLAHTWLEAVDRWLKWSGGIPGRAESQLLWAQYHLANDDPNAALLHATVALRLAGKPRQPLALVASHRFLGHLTILDGRFDEAKAHLEAALQLAVACAAPFEQALTKLEFARLHVRQGREGEGRAALAEVRQVCEPLGARRVLRSADEIEAEIGSQPAYRPAGLTPRELDVLRLVAEGLTDPEVAERLFVSPRTVSSHLTSIYTKLGVSSRAAATRIVVERGIL